MRFSGSGTGHSCQDSYFSAFCFARPFLYFSHLLINSTEVQNPRHNLDGKYLCLSYVFGSVFTCAKSAHVSQKLSYSFCRLVFNNFSSDTETFLRFIAFSAPQQQYIVEMADLVAVT